MLDMFPDTAGNIVVAVNDRHLKALLNSNDIDYVIPYHLSGLNKEMRLMMSIEQWVDYTRKQNERKIPADKNNTRDKNRHKSPKFSEWFDEAAAAKAEDGYAFMREAARKYISLCEERGLEPKFNEFKTEENYRKLLIDRKMVNQKTGKVILQQAVKPIFDGNAIAVAQNAIADEQAIKDFREVQDSLVEQITSGKVKISDKMTAELAAMQNAPFTSEMETESDGRMFELREKTITRSDIQALRSIKRQSVNNSDSNDIQKAEKWARKYYQELKEKSPFFRAWFGDWRANDTSPVDISKMERREGKNPRGQFRNNDTGWVINSSSVGYDATISHSGADKKSVRAMQNIDKIIENSILLNTEASEYGRGKKSIYTAFMHKFYALVDIDGKPYLAKMSVDESYSPGQNETNKKFYHVRSIEIETAPSVGIGNSHTPIMESTVSNYTVLDLYTFVKRFDKDFSGFLKISNPATGRSDKEFWKADSPRQSAPGDRRGARRAGGAGSRVHRPETRARGK